MPKEIINTAKAPAAIGPYSQGTLAKGETCYISGQLPIDPATGIFAGEDIRAQTRQSLENIKAILASAGAEMKHVVKTTVYLKDMKDFGAMNEVYANYFEGDYPARVAVEISCLPKDAKVEIEAIAVL